MQAMLLLPSLMMSIMWAVRTNEWTIAYMTAASSLVSLIIARRRSLQTSAPVLPVSYRRGRVFLGDRRLPRSSKLWLPSWRRHVKEHISSLPNEQRNSTLLAEAKARGFQSTSAGRLVSWLGVRSDNHFELDLALDGPHLFVVGPTGSGKSQFLRLMLRSVTARYGQSRLAIQIADFKGSALMQGLEIAPWVWASIDDLETTSHSEFWQSLSQELESRELALKKAARSEFDPFEFGNRLLLLVVDEVAAACRSSVRASELLAAVAARGRSLGIILVAANQGMSGVPRELLLNLRLRIALAGTDQVELVQLGAQSGKLLQVERNWIAARAISHASDDRDFVFPLESA